MDLQSTVIQIKPKQASTEHLNHIYVGFLKLGNFDSARAHRSGYFYPCTFF